MDPIEVRRLNDGDRDWVQAFIAERWGAPLVVAHGTVYHPHELPGFVAADENALVGLVTYRIDGDACEVVTIDSLRPQQGIGTRLLGAARAEARRAGCRRLWLITTNDNLNALRFWQKRGLRLVAVHRDAVTRSRALKPAIPFAGADGIPIQDELELEQILQSEDQTGGMPAPHTPVRGSETP
jgi:GNAT superfamily N-acetyltransferase